MLNNRSQTQKIMYYIISYETSKKGKSREIESRSMIAWGNQQWRGLIEMGKREFMDDRSILKLDFGEGCTTIEIY